MPFPAGQSGNPAAQFTSENQPENPGRILGVPNRATVLKRLLALTHRFEDPITGQQVNGTVEDAMAWGIIAKAIQGDTPAFKEVFDSVYGKITDKQEILLPVKTVIRIGGKRPTSTDATQPPLPADK